jgi:hypothetical protein
MHLGLLGATETMERARQGRGLRSTE